MMKPLMIGALSLAALAIPMAASAQSRYHDYDRDRGGYEQRWDRRDDHRDYRRDGRDYRDYRSDGRDYRDHRDYRRDGRAYSYNQHRWYRGAVVPYEYRRNWYVSDYRRYGWRAPPRGYGYYRTDSGDIVIAALATGVILSLLNN